MNKRQVLLGLTLAATVAATSYSLAEPNRSRGTDGSSRPTEPSGQNRPPKPQGDVNVETLKQALSDLEAAKAKLARVTDLAGRRDRAKTAVENAITETRDALVAAEESSKADRDGSRGRTDKAPSRPDVRKK